MAMAVSFLSSARIYLWIAAFSLFRVAISSDFVNTLLSPSSSGDLLHSPLALQPFPLWGLIRQSSLYLGGLSSFSYLQNLAQAAPVPSPGILLREEWDTGLCI